MSARKDDHIRINLEEDVHSGVSTGLDALHYAHNALPEIDLKQVRTGQTLFGRTVSFPLLVSSMTGGTPDGERVNLQLAMAAQAYGLAMGVGSQRILLDQPETLSSFNVRRLAPDILLFANLGAVQLNRGSGIEDCRRIVDQVQADALILHLNPLQEALQDQGDTDFSGLLSKIENICRRLDRPVIVKEVGWGISGEVARKLAQAGVSAIDVAGAGGTSWSQVEMFRTQDESLKGAAASFRGWGIPTAESLRQVKLAVPDLPVIASGGLRNGIELAKCITLGACLGGMAGSLLRAAAQGTLDHLIRQVRTELTTTMFATGSIDLAALRKADFLRSSS